MKATTYRSGISAPPRSMSRHVPLLILGLLALAILSIFVLPPDATRVLGYSSAAPSSNPGGGCSYRVLPGDNLYRIGLRYGVQYQYLAMINGILNPHFIVAGSVLSVPCGPAPVPDGGGQPCGPAQTYVVKPGDNLFRIALNHGSTVDLIRAANNLYGRVLRPGMNLILPCAGTGAAAPVPPVPGDQVIGIPPLPTVPASQGAPVVTPEVTIVAPGGAVTPAITLVSPPAATPSAGTPVNQGLAPQLVSTPLGVSTNNVVSMRGNQFSKGVLQIRVGSRVTWVNDETDGSMHTVTCAECPQSFSFDSGSTPIGPGKSYSVVFTVPGVFFYYSRLQQQMAGMIIVSR